MDNEARNKLVSLGVMALQALKTWFEKGHRPTVDELKILKKLDLVAESGLTPEGKKMLMRLITDQGLTPPGIRIFMPDSQRNYVEVDPSDFLEETSPRKAPDLGMLHQFDQEVCQAMRDIIPTGVCPECEGRQIILTNRGLILCPNCKGSGKV